MLSAGMVIETISRPISVVRFGSIGMHSRIATCLVSAVVGVASLSGALAAEKMSEQDKAFVAKVSQGGMYEVALGKVAEEKGATQDVRDQGNTEAHDHMLVGDKLKSIVTKAGMSFPDKLNSEFQARLDKIKALSGTEFDNAYIEDMKKIHAADGAAFKKESKDGTDQDLKSFALETYRIVQRHIGELDVKVP